MPTPSAYASLAQRLAASGRLILAGAAVIPVMWAGLMVLFDRLDAHRAYAVFFYASWLIPASWWLAIVYLNFLRRHSSQGVRGALRAAHSWLIALILDLWFLFLCLFPFMWA